MLAILLSLLTAANLWASELDTVCQNAHRTDPTNPSYSSANPPLFAEGLMGYRGQGEFVVSSLAGERLLAYPERLQSLVWQGDTLWALASFELLEFNRKGDLLARYQLEHAGNPAWRGKSMVLAGDKLIIARGLAGMYAFDTQAKTWGWSTLMSEIDGGMPVAVAYDGKEAIAIMATTRELGFTGVVRMDPVTGKTLGVAPYDQQRAGVIDTDPFAHWHAGKLILNNGGWIHVITAQQIAQGRKLRPRWVAHAIPEDGEVQPHYMMLTGDFFLEQDHVVGCGIYTAQSADGRFIRKSTTFKVKLP